MKPLIAIPGRRLRHGRIEGWKEDALGAPSPYIEGVRRAGAVEAVLFPTPVSEGEAREMLARFDGLLLMGGGDVDPSRYGQERHEEVYGVSALHDGFEIALVNAALELRMPILAICRGMQVLNVALGGTLIQHLEDEVVSHRSADEPWASHGVRLTPGSRVAEAMGSETVVCAVSHHQAIDRPGEGLVPTGWAEDDVIEAAELDDGWVVAVQWHPERTSESDPAQQGLFDTLAARAAERSATRA